MIYILFIFLGSKDWEFEFLDITKLYTAFVTS